MKRRSRLRHGVYNPSQIDHVDESDSYELSEGHPIYAAPTGGDGARGAVAGAEVLDTDPGVESAGMDAGYALSQRTLRAPDVSVGRVPDAPGWIAGAPLLAVEYASTGQDEADLQLKIRELLRAGTRYVWVVRLVGPRKVEVHEPGKLMRVAMPGEELDAPDVLRNRVPVEALFDRQAAHELALRNLLQRKGYSDLEEVRKEVREEGQQRLRDTLRAILRAKGMALGPAEEARIASCRDAAVLERWIVRTATARTTIEVLE